MSISSELLNRADHKCELCGSDQHLQVWQVSFAPEGANSDVLVCETCQSQLNNGDLVGSHWRCLSDSMWSPVAAVQVQAWRTLKMLDAEVWAQELLDMLYLDEELMAWASAGVAQQDAEPSVRCLDSNGVQLAAGDNVVVIKDLPVKGTSMVAKRGTAVRGISLTDNPEHIEGRVNGQRIVLLSCYVKKS